MSIALESNCNTGEMRETGPIEIACVATAAIFDSPAADVDESCRSSSGSLSQAASSTTTSSIGKNSDASSDDENCGEENEVQSAYKGALDDAMDSLEAALPMRRGISNFYTGKSKSFTSLSEAASSACIKEIAKPENAYTRRRRNLLAFNHVWDKNGSFPHRRNAGRISKRPISSSRSALALAVVMNSSFESNGSTSEDSSSSSVSMSPNHLPPLHPRSRTYHNNLASLSSPRQNFSQWRSFSVADLPECATAPGKTDQ